jgi:hypothetical protein
MSITLEQSYIFSALQGGQGPEFGLELRAGHKKITFLYLCQVRDGSPMENSATKSLPKAYLKVPLIRRDSHGRQEARKRQRFDMRCSCAGRVGVARARSPLLLFFVEARGVCSGPGRVPADSP